MKNISVEKKENEEAIKNGSPAFQLLQNIINKNQNQKGGKKKVDTKKKVNTKKKNNNKKVDTKKK